MQAKSYKKILIISAYIYLLCPVLIFVCGWLRWYVAAPILAIILVATVCVFGSIRCSKSAALTAADFKRLLVIAVIIAIWVLFSGIGGLSYQSQDHEYRTVIYRALVEYTWPVRSANGQRGLIYYIGYWLPSALVGKLLGYKMGYVFQAVWACLGIFLVYALLCVRRKKIDIWPLVMMIFFSGLDYIGVWLLGKGGTDLLDPIHLEWWAIDFQYSSMTTQLYWVFNQAIPAWVALALIVAEKDKRHVLYILSLIMFTSTFPFVGAIPIACYVIFKNFHFRERQDWKEVFTFPNIIGAGCICFLFLIYLIGNISATNVGTDNAASTSEYVDFSAQMISYSLFCVLEFGVYFVFIYRYHKKDALYYILLAVLLVCPFIKVGGAHDFCMRASIPALFILMLWCMDAVEQMHQEHRWKQLAAFSILLLIGAITPFNEIHKSVKETIISYENERSSQAKEVDIEKQLFKGNNFSGSVKDNLFYQYFARGVDISKQYQHLLEAGIVKSDETLYYEDENLKEGDFATFCDEITDAGELLNAVRECDSDFLISYTNMRMLVTEYPDEMAQLIREEYICDQKFAQNLYFKRNKYENHYAVENILWLPGDGFSYSNKKYWAQTEAEVIIFNPYTMAITAEVEFVGILKDEAEDLYESATLTYGDLQIEMDNFTNDIALQDTLEIPAGLSVMKIDLQMSEELKTQKIYQVNEFSFTTESVYESISPEASCQVVVEAEKVPVVEEEEIVDPKDDEQLGALAEKLEANDKDQLLIEDQILVALMQKLPDECSELLLNQYRLLEQEGGYSLFERQSSHSVSKESAIVTLIGEADPETGEIIAYILNPYEEDVSAKIDITVKITDALVAVNNKMRIAFGEEKKRLTLNKSKRTTELEYVLVNGVNEIVFSSNMENYVLKDGEKQYFSIDKMEISLAQIETAASDENN